VTQNFTVPATPVQGGLPGNRTAASLPLAEKWAGTRRLSLLFSGSYMQRNI